MAKTICLNKLVAQAFNQSKFGESLKLKKVYKCKMAQKFRF